MRGTIALVIVTALIVSGGCAANSPPIAAPPATSSPANAPPSPSHKAPRAPAVASNPPRIAPAGWATTPVAVSHQPAVPPVPVLQSVRYAAHKDGYDRIVLDIPGALPGYTAKYVASVRQDGSGKPVAMPGEAYLLVVLHPAQAHRDDGTTTVTGIHRIGLAGIKAYAIVGDYEGHVSVALGLSGVRKFHIGELPGRIYIDVAI